MDDNFHYGTITQAIKKLREEGFTIDFNLKENHFLFEGNKIEVDGYEIVDTYRYEGDSNPSDESVVYAIESKTGIKGILTSGYGIYSDPYINGIIEQLHNREA